MMTATEARDYSFKGIGDTQEIKVIERIIKNATDSGAFYVDNVDFSYNSGCYLREMGYAVTYGNRNGGDIYYGGKVSW